MGSGKSTLGPVLAEALGYAFVDLDDYIEERADCTIREIFERQSEQKFREMEAEALVASFEWTDKVIALGGGALATEDAMERALQKGLVVYLYASEKTLITRLKPGAMNRPLFTGKDQVKALLTAREPVYRRAHIVFSTEDYDSIQASKRLIAAVESSIQSHRHEP